MSTTQAAVMASDWQIDTFRRHMIPLLDETGRRATGGVGRPAALFRLRLNASQGTGNYRRKLTDRTDSRRAWVHRTHRAVGDRDSTAHPLEPTLITGLHISQNLSLDRAFCGRRYVECATKTPQMSRLNRSDTGNN